MLVPAEILNKPGKLTDIEFSIVKTHPKTGHDVVEPIEFQWSVAETIIQHHERLDGSGYPKGLSKDSISIAAKIIAVADVVEAITSHRPYRPALGIKKALKEIEVKKGKLFDTKVVNCCVKLFNDNKFKF